MTTIHTLGYPRIGAQRELKFALESFWKGAASEADLLATGRTLRERHWNAQRDAGLDFVTVGDFAWYDQVLQTAALLGALPTRYGFDAARLTLAQSFVLARGNADHAAMEMTKWFDTNYHYLVPELTPDLRFGPGTGWLFDEVREAQAAGHRVKVALLGPVTFLHLAKARGGLADKLSLLPQLLQAYTAVLQRLAAQGWNGCRSTNPRWYWTCRKPGRMPTARPTGRWRRPAAPSCCSPRISKPHRTTRR